MYFFFFCVYWLRLLHCIFHMYKYNVLSWQLLNLLDHEDVAVCEMALCLIQQLCDRRNNTFKFLLHDIVSRLLSVIEEGNTELLRESAAFTLAQVMALNNYFTIFNLLQFKGQSCQKAVLGLWCIFGEFFFTVPHNSVSGIMWFLISKTPLASSQYHHNCRELQENHGSGLSHTW